MKNVTDTSAFDCTIWRMAMQNSAYARYSDCTEPGDPNDFFNMILNELYMSSMNNKDKELYKLFNSELLCKTEEGEDIRMTSQNMSFLYLCDVEESSMQSLVNNYFMTKQQGTRTITTTMMEGAEVLFVVNPNYQVPISDINNLLINSMNDVLQYRIDSVICYTHLNGIEHFVAKLFNHETNIFFICDDDKIREFEASNLKPYTFVYRNTG